jgi:uncharacterized protein DUF6702
MRCLLGSALFLPREATPPVATHPLHSALAELEYQPNSGAILIRVRIFTDDLAAALRTPKDSYPADSLLSGYARGTLALTDQAGHPLPLIWQGVEHTGDTVLLQLRAKLTGGLQSARVLVALLWERFPDQVNIVRATYGGRTVTLLFTRGDGAKPFP